MKTETTERDRQLEAARVNDLLVYRWRFEYSDGEVLVCEAPTEGGAFRVADATRPYYAPDSMAQMDPA